MGVADRTRAPACARPPRLARWARRAKWARRATRDAPTPSAAPSAPPASGSCLLVRSRSAPWTRGSSRPSCPTRRKKGVPESLAAQIVALESISYIVGQLVGGALSDRFGRRPVGIAALAVVGLGSTAAFAGTGAMAEIAIAGVVLYGFGMGATIALRSAAFSNVFGGPNFGSIFGVLAVAYPLGGDPAH